MRKVFSGHFGVLSNTLNIDDIYVLSVQSLGINLSIITKHLNLGHSNCPFGLSTKKLKIKIENRCDYLFNKIELFLLIF